MDIPKAAGYGVSAALFAAMLQKSDDASFWAKSPLLGTFMGVTMALSLGSGSLLEFWRKNSPDKEPSNLIITLVALPPYAGFLTLAAFIGTFSPHMAWEMSIALAAAFSMQYAVPDPKKKSTAPASQDSAQPPASPPSSDQTLSATPIASPPPSAE